MCCEKDGFGEMGEGDLREKLSYWRLEISIKGKEVRAGKGSFENSENIVLINLKYLIICKYRNVFR